MRYLVILLLSVCVLSCGKDDNNPVEPQHRNDIFPLEIGNYWIYERITLYGGGYELDTVEYSVPRDTTIEGERWFKLAQDGQETVWCVNRSDGHWRAGPPEYLYYKYPTQTGDQYWISNGNTITVENDSDMVNVTAGEFCCVSYVLNIPDWNGFERWKLSPGCGPVWGEARNEMNEIYGGLTLLSYLVQ